MPILPSLTNVSTTTKQRPFPLITIYGQAGVGKTTLAAEFPRPFLINIEGGVPEGIDIPCTPETIRDFDYLLGWLDVLIDNKHEYKTVIIDSLDTLEKKVIHPYVLKQNEFDSVDQLFGRAYTRSAEFVDKVLDRLEILRFKKRMFVVLTAAAVKETFDDLVNKSYHRFNLALQNQVSTRIFHQSDFLFFMRPEVYMVQEDGKGKKERPTSTSRRELCTTLMPQYIAKSRAKGLPPVMIYDLGRGFEVLRQPLTNFITGKSKLQEVEAPLQVAEGQTVAEAKAKAEAAKQEDAIAGVPEQDTTREEVLADKLMAKVGDKDVSKEKALEVARQLIASVEAKQTKSVDTTPVDPDDDAGNAAVAERLANVGLTDDLNDDIPF